MLGPRGQVDPVVVAVQRAGEWLAGADVALVEDDAAPVARVGDLQRREVGQPAEHGGVLLGDLRAGDAGGELVLVIVARAQPGKRPTW